MVHYSAAIPPLREAIDLAPDFANARALLGLTHHFLDETPDGIRELERAVELSNQDHWPLAILGAVYAESGDERQAREILAELIERAQHRHVSATHFAAVYAALREKDAALEWLEGAAEERATLLPLCRFDTYPGWFLGHLRSEPRYQAVERGFGFP